MARTHNKDDWKHSRRMEHLAPRHPYYIFCEGTETEPNYFKAFRREINSNAIYRNSVTVEISPVGRGTLEIMREAEKYVRREHITNGQIWIVYDKDDFTPESFDGVVDKAYEINKDLTDRARSGEKPSLQYRCAWSNESFELWFILHFINYQVNNGRAAYIDRLNRIFQQLQLGAYRKNQTDMFDILLQYGDPKSAIRYARRLLADKEHCKPSEIVPATKVYELVEELVQYLPEEMRDRFIDAAADTTAE